jgi:hypothetical protein
MWLFVGARSSRAPNAWKKARVITYFDYILEAERLVTAGL